MPTSNAPAARPVVPPLAIAILALVLAAASGCSNWQSRGCTGSATRMQQDTLYFGTATPAGTVSAAQWQAFLADSVTPAFPQGLTAWNADGQWRSDDGRIVQESSYVLTLVHAPDAASDAAIAGIVATYKQRFHQEAVLRLQTPACVRF